MPLSASALRALQQDREPQLPYGSVLEQEPGRQVVACSDPAAIVPLSGRWQALSAAFNQADMPIHDVMHNILQANVDHRVGSAPGLGGLSGDGDDEDVDEYFQAIVDDVRRRRRTVNWPRTLTWHTS